MTVDWDSFQKCPVCAAELGKPCMAFLGVVAGVGAIEEEAVKPHTGRELRAGR